MAGTVRGSGPTRAGDLTGIKSRTALDGMDPKDAAERSARITTLTRGSAYAVERAGVVNYAPPSDETAVVVQLRWYDAEPMAMTFGRAIDKEAVLDQDGNLVTPPKLGAMRHYRFEAGVSYRIPWGMFEHLRERNLIETAEGKKLPEVTPVWDSSNGLNSTIPFVGEYPQDNSIDLSKEQ